MAKKNLDGNKVEEYRERREQAIKEARDYDVTGVNEVLRRRGIDAGVPATGVAAGTVVGGTATPAGTAASATTRKVTKGS
jgi:hypothetical protein